MAGPNLLTKDDVPLRDIGTDIFEMLEVFNEEADQGFINMVSSEVNSRTFMARTGDFSWEEVAELEHAKTASIDDYQLAFGVDMYAKSLGMSREFVEDSPAEYIREHVAEVVASGQDRMFDVTFDTMRNGIADGSTLWYDPQDYGAYSFSQTHNHTYTGLTNEAADTARVLSAYLNSRWKDSPAVFPSHSSNRISEQGVRNMLHKIAEAAEVHPYKIDGTRGDASDVTPHSLRHGIAYRMMNEEDGNTLYDVRNRLRHRSIQTTERIYDHMLKV